MSCERILITGDFFRYKPDDLPGKPTFAEANICWLYDLLGPIIRRASGKKVDSFLNRFEAKERHTAVELVHTYTDWVSTYHRGMVTVGEAEAISQYIPADVTLVVGFELSPFQQALFNAINLDWISLAVSPVRFCRDYFIEFKTNRSDLLAPTLQEYAVSDKQIKDYADYCQARYRRFSKFELAPDSLLFCGQVVNDASLIIGDQMALVQNYHDKIENLAQQFDRLYYKKHPYAENLDSTLELIGRIPNSYLINADVYELMSRHEITTVAALSSSVLTEADYFDKISVRLLNNENHDPKWTMDKHILTPHFWADILGIKKLGERESLVLQDYSPISSALQVSWRYSDNIR